MSFFMPSDGAPLASVGPPVELGRDDRAAAELSRRERIGLVILFAAATALLFGALGSKQLWKSEARWGQVAREMMRTGDYFQPRIDGENYNYKPLVGYWLVVLAAKASGGLSEWAVRLPSVLAGLAALAATVSLGRRLWSARVAISAGWMLLTSYGFLFYARMGMADMENVAAIMLAVAWYWRIRERPGLVGYAVFYLICALGAQTKGLTAIVVPMLAIFPDLARAGRWRKHLNVAHAAGLAIGAALYLAPFQMWPGGLTRVIRENFQRAVDPFDHEEPVYAYLYHVPILFLPWSPLLVLAVAWVARRWKQVDGHTRWLALALLLIFALFTASGSRRSYYILPILPPAALLCSVGLWAPGLAAQKRALVRIARWVAIGAAVVWVISPIGALLVKWRYGVALPAALVWGTPVIGLAALVPLSGRWFRFLAPKAGETPAPQDRGLAANRGGGRLARLQMHGRRWLWHMAVYPGLAPAAAAAAVIMGGFFFVQHPAMDAAGGHKEFAAQVRARIPGPPGTVRVGVYKEVPATFLFYLNEPTPTWKIKTSEELAAFLSAGPGPCLVVVHQRFLGRLRDLGFPAERIKRPDAKEHTWPWQGDDSEESLRAFIIHAPAGA